MDEVDDGEDLVAVGGDLRAGTLVEAYRSGVFPMGLGDFGARPHRAGGRPTPAACCCPAGVHASRSLRKSLRRFEMRVDTAFREVVEACADPSREGRWITEEIADAYTRAARAGLGAQHRDVADGELVGGLYGVNIGGLFAGESMFHRVTDASKAAVVAMAAYVFADGDPRRLIDVQWATDHLRSLGVVTGPARDYLRARSSRRGPDRRRFAAGPEPQPPSLSRRCRTRYAACPPSAGTSPR